MLRKAMKLEMLRKMTSSARGLKPSISILKEVSEDGPKVGHLYGNSVIRNPLGARHYGSAANGVIIKSTSSSSENKGKSEKEKYDALRERQLKLEMEAWSNALKEYQELLAVMCEKKLTPNIPYIKSLILGWFEPLKDAISAEQDLCKKSTKNHASGSYIQHAPYFLQLPADMMALITMHKLMALLMVADVHGFVTLMQASSEIGEAIEHEAKVHRLLEKSKIKPEPNSHVEGSTTKDQMRLGKKVAELMEKQKGHQIRVIVNKHDDSKPWGLHNQVKDGSCNGLQHYAALGRDKPGAKAVNLVAGDKPADVYSDIAKRVSEIMRRDAKKDPSNPNARCAKLLLDQVDRKLVKQTVMTSVYGVTFIGACHQIKKRLKERDVIADDRELFAAAGYAAKVTMTAQGEMFQEARDIMSWLSDCAKIIASENQPVQWTTPVGLPVVQHYRKLGLRRVKTSLQLLTVRHEHETDKIMKKRQRTAFPPNFVHSLDSSHMMMTAVACKRLGLCFAGVHDSYWTHACDVDEMNRILREKFVELYEQPILENLLESFQTSFPKLEFPPLPARGDFDLRDVLESRYFFS